MAYNLDLKKKIQDILEGLEGLTEKEMFGGIGFMVHGNMACGVIKDDLIVRVGLDQYNDCLKIAHTHIFDMTGRPMRGWVLISPEGYEKKGDLKFWVEKGLNFARSLPAK